MSLLEAHALVCVLADYTIHLYHPRTGSVSPLYRPDKPAKEPLTECHLALPRCVPWIYFCAAGRSSVHVISATAAGTLATRVSRKKPVTAMAAHPRDPILFVAYLDGTLSGFDMDTPPTPQGQSPARSGAGKVEAQPRWTAGDEAGGRRGSAARVIHTLCFHPRAGGRLMYAGDSVGDVTALAVGGGAPPRLLDRTHVANAAVRCLAFANPGGGDGMLLVLAVTGGVTAWEVAAQAGGLCRTRLQGFDAGHLLAHPVDGPPRRLAELAASPACAASARALVVDLAVVGGSGMVAAVVSTPRAAQEQSAAQRADTRKELLKVACVAERLRQSGGLNSQAPKAQAARAALNQALRVARARAPTEARLGRAPAIEDFVDAALYSFFARRQADADAAAPCGSLGDAPAVEPRVALLTLSDAGAAQQPFAAGVFTRCHAPVWYLAGGSAAQAARSLTKSNAPAFAFPGAFHYLEAGKRLGKYELADHLTSTRLTLPQDAAGAQRGAPAPKAVAIQESPAGDAWLVKYRRQTARGRGLGVTVLLRDVPSPNRVGLRECVDAAFLPEGRLALLVATAGSGEGGKSEVHIFAAQDAIDASALPTAVPCAAIMLRKPAERVFAGARAGWALIAGPGKLRAVQAPVADAVDEPAASAQGSLRLQPSERVVDVAWQRMALSHRLQDSPKTPAVAAVLTTLRLLIVTERELSVLSQTSSPACGLGPVLEPFAFHSCLWAGPCLLYSAAGGEVGALLWDSSVRKVASVDAGGSACAPVALLACLQDRLLVGALNPLSGRVEVSRRAVALLEPLTLALVTYAQSTDPANGKRRMEDHELNGALEALVGSFDGSLAPRPALRALCARGLADLAVAMATAAEASTGDRFECYLAAGEFVAASAMLRDEYEHASDFPNLPAGSLLAGRMRRLARAMVAAGQPGAAAEVLAMAGDAMAVATLAALKRDPEAARSVPKLCRGAPTPGGEAELEDAELSAQEEQAAADAAARGRVLYPRAKPAAGEAEIARALAAVAGGSLSTSDATPAGAPVEDLFAAANAGAEADATVPTGCGDFTLVRRGGIHGPPDFVVEEGLSATIKVVSEAHESGFEIVTAIPRSRLDQFIADRANVDGSAGQRGAGGAGAQATAGAPPPPPPRPGLPTELDIATTPPRATPREADAVSDDGSEASSSGRPRTGSSVDALKRALYGAGDVDGEGGGGKLNIRIRSADDVVTPSTDPAALKTLTGALDLSSTGTATAKKGGFRFKSRMAADSDSDSDSASDEDADSSDESGSVDGAGMLRRAASSVGMSAVDRESSQGEPTSPRTVETPRTLGGGLAMGMPTPSTMPSSGTVALISQAVEMRQQATKKMEDNNVEEARQWLATALGDLAQQDIADHSTARKEASMCVRYAVACGLLEAIAERTTSERDKARLARQMASLPLAPRHRLLALRASAQRDAALGNWALARKAIVRMPAGAPGVAKMRAVAARHGDNDADPEAAAANPAMFCCSTLEPLVRPFAACVRCGARFNVVAGVESGDPCALCLAGTLRAVR